MQGDSKVIDYLNAELKNELTAVHQYLLHARLYQHWGFEELGAHEYDESMDELTHADKLIERILMLDGLPNLHDLHALAIGKQTLEALQNDLKLEQAAQAQCKEGIVYCESVRDFVSRGILVELLDATEDHIDWLEIQIGLIDKIGIENYQQSAIRKLA
ncbi:MULTISPECIES: bacterioferritin [Caballeronia]|uniref:Bacterioferritin n=1 Tax=Caballeronia zhejiangensis TaxID=871203 RepID=A0A656QD34_9BURK|nr:MULTISPECIES: bacterioferritin [Caballeronia]EKS71604.1 bacterioferritin [Burkholderia sp. SJ98]KDR26460.1 bacterioferritin [Caballeronia zhejiangensis]MDR5790607.1 bacterioferritin [Caballeronia sp. LP003]